MPARAAPSPRSDPPARGDDDGGRGAAAAAAPATARRTAAPSPRGRRAAAIAAPAIAAAAAAATAAARARRAAVGAVRRHPLGPRVTRLDERRRPLPSPLRDRPALRARGGERDGRAACSSSTPSDLPQISALDDYAPSTITRVYAADGEVVGEFATQRRIVIAYDADLAAAAAGDHRGRGRRVRHAHGPQHHAHRRDAGQGPASSGERAGASTLTQQLRATCSSTDEKTWERKIKEAILAIQIEKRYTKREILTLYCNQIPWGHGTYGAEAAARLYFGKSAKDVTLEEAALLAGIIQAPARQSPYVNLENALRAAQLRARRRWPTTASSRRRAREAAKKTPIVTRRPARSLDADRAVLRRGRAAAPRGALRRAGSSTRTASPSTPRST